MLQKYSLNVLDLVQVAHEFVLTTDIIGCEERSLNVHVFNNYRNYTFTTRLVAVSLLIYG